MGNPKGRPKLTDEQRLVSEAHKKELRQLRQRKYNAKRKQRMLDDPDFYAKIKQYSDDYKSNNADYLREYSKKYYNDNREEILEKQRIWRESQPRKCKALQRKYYFQNRDSRLLEKKKWHEEHKDQEKQYYLSHKDEIMDRVLDYHKKRKQEDSLYSFKSDMRSFIYHSFTRLGYKKNTKSEKIIGCTFQELLEYLNLPSDFFTNRSKYHIDHIIPLATAKTEEDIIRLCHYSNLQILTAKENLKKHDSVPNHLLEKLEDTLPKNK